MRPLASMREHVELDGAEDGQTEHRHDLQDKSVVDLIPTRTQRAVAWQRGVAWRDIQINRTVSGTKLKTLAPWDSRVPRR